MVERYPIPAVAPDGRSSFAARRTRGMRVHRAFRAAMDELLLWRERQKQRRCLEAMSDELLKDIGLTRFDACAESRKWPWRP